MALAMFLGACGGDGTVGDLDGGAGPGADADPGGSVDAADSVDAGPTGAVCGDGVREGSEGCDDGNTDSGDGCSDECAVEQDWACPSEGEPCVLVVVCGNGTIEGDETCDDGNADAGDGCSAECQVEDGWTCPLAGTSCVAAECGDGFVAGLEACDDGNTDDDDGCSADCKLEDGWHCPVPGDPCEETTCGDGVVEGTEECDDGNAVVGDGCAPDCTREPDCMDGTCTAVCGDGVVWEPEECDDGNNLSGDGCDASCEVEPGFECEEMQLPDPPEVSIPATVRDFVAACNTEDGDDRRLADDESGAVPPYGHRDFECFNEGLELGMVEDTLDADGKPVRQPNDSTHDADSFALWYRSNPDYNRTVARTITLPSIGSGIYQFDDESFYPMTGDGFVVEDCNGEPCEQTHADGNDAGQQNFHFTSEVRYWFEYNGTELLQFSGDDDVWVFINGRLAVDIGGVHGREDDQVDLGDSQVASDLGLTIGGIYEAVVFHAERHTSRSQYRLTLSNFNRAPSVCTDECGDGEVSSQEVCDDGADNGMGDGSGYGGCADDCTLEPYCGDGIVDESHGEVCDDGLNLGGDASECAPGCQSMGATCGDGVVQTDAGEQCDDGNTMSGDGCSADCQLEVD